MNITGEITIKMPIEEANDLKMELYNIIEFVIIHENKDNPMPTNVSLEFLSSLRRCLEYGDEYESWDLRRRVDKERINVND